MWGRKTDGVECFLCSKSTLGIFHFNPLNSWPLEQTSCAQGKCRRYPLSGTIYGRGGQKRHPQSSWKTGGYRDPCGRGMDCPKPRCPEDQRLGKGVGSAGRLALCACLSAWAPWPQPPGTAQVKYTSPSELICFLISTRHHQGCQSISLSGVVFTETHPLSIKKVLFSTPDHNFHKRGKRCRPTFSMKCI